MAMLEIKPLRNPPIEDLIFAAYLEETDANLRGLGKKAQEIRASIFTTIAKASKIAEIHGNAYTEGTELLPLDDVRFHPLKEVWFWTSYNRKPVPVFKITRGFSE